MAFSASLAARVRQSLGHDRAIEEKRMFGGLGFLLRGNLLVAVWGTGLIARVGVEPAAEYLRQQFVRPFDVTGKPMKGWIVVDAEGLDTDAELAAWLERARDFVETLPPK
jgi:hypothetical protein